MLTTWWCDRDTQHRCPFPVVGWSTDEGALNEQPIRDLHFSTEGHLALVTYSYTSRYSWTSPYKKSLRSLGGMTPQHHMFACSMTKAFWSLHSDAWASERLTYPQGMSDRFCIFPWIDILHRVWASWIHGERSAQHNREWLIDTICFENTFLSAQILEGEIARVIDIVIDIIIDVIRYSSLMF